MAQATCTTQVKSNIQQTLRLGKDTVMIKSSFNRPEIAYEVRYKELIGDGSEDAVLDDLVAFVRARAGTCGIVYARLRKTCDAVAKALECADLDVAAYHGELLCSVNAWNCCICCVCYNLVATPTSFLHAAGKDPQVRNRIQSDWSSGDTPVVVATVAFGMGINKPDVR
eukprot:364707-Chlamydomonas_euryale.AAC.11